MYSQKFYSILRSKLLLLFIFLFPFSELYAQDKAAIVTQISKLIDNAQYKPAQKKVDSIIVVCSETKDHHTLSRAYNLKGTICRELGKMNDALHFFSLAIDLNIEAKDSFALSGCYTNMGTIYSELNENENALKYYKMAIELIKDENDPNTLTVLYNNIGNIYKNNEEYNLSNHYLKKSLNIALQTRDSFLLAMVYHNIGNNMEGVSKYDSAIVLFNESLSYLDKFELGLGHIFNYEHLGICYNNLKNFKEGEKYLRKALDISDNTKITTELVQIYNSLAFTYSSKGDYKSAFHYQELHLKRRELDFQENTHSAMRKFEYDNELKHQKEQQLREQKQRDEINLAKLEAKNRTIYLFVLALVFVIILIFFVIRNNRQKHKANQIISKQKELVEQKNEEILSSINYAKRIQQTLLAHDDLLEKEITQLSISPLDAGQRNYFVFYHPKDIVSGDFYWATTTGSASNRKFYLAVCDSTGHGVPGAFMSLLNIGFLSEAINEKNITKPNEVLNYVRQRLIDNISKEGQKDGFDGILLCFERSNENIKITYAAANNAPVLIQNNELKEQACDRMPVGMGVKKQDFQLYTIDGKAGDTIYLPTDGYGDQFGGPKARQIEGSIGQGKKFMKRHLNELFLKISKESQEEQLNFLKTTFEDWRGDLEQIDDVCIIGIKI